MNLRKGRLYLVTFWDHNESTKRSGHKHRLRIVGRYLKTRDGYLIFCNWFPEPFADGDTMTRANVLKKAVIRVQELVPRKETRA